MTRLPQALRISLIACSIPAVLIAAVATMGAAFGWSGLSFSSPMYYLILTIAAWCPLSKVLLWQFRQRQMNACVVCVPASAVQRRLAASTAVRSADRRGVAAAKESNRG